MNNTATSCGDGITAGKPGGSGAARATSNGCTQMLKPTRSTGSLQLNGMKNATALWATKLFTGIPAGEPIGIRAMKQNAATGSIRTCGTIASITLSPAMTGGTFAKTTTISFHPSRTDKEHHDAVPAHLATDTRHLCKLHGFDHTPVCRAHGRLGPFYSLITIISSLLCISQSLTSQHFSAIITLLPPIKKRFRC